jgi:hypothetical protein
VDLFIGNATRQVYDFSFKLPETETFRSQKIQPGTQERIGGDLTIEDIDYIIKKHAKYGLIPQEEIDRSKAFHGTCYSIGKPITVARLTYLLDHNLGELVDLGRTIRQANAIAQNGNVEAALRESGRPERVAALDMTVQQEDQDPRNDVPQFSVGMMVTAEAERGKRGSGKRGRRTA